MGSQSYAEDRGCRPPVMALSEVEKARTFHESFPQYSVTPLVKLNHMAEKLGLGSLYIKDESYRFGTQCF